MAHSHDHNGHDHSGSHHATGAFWDSSAVGLSSLCLAHCLALPVLAAALPALGALTRADWVHIVFVVIALPLSVVALWRRPDNWRDITIMLLATLGIVLLAAGAFPERWRDLSEQLTILGSIALVTAHVWNRWLLRYCAVQPPSTGKRAPLTDAPASDTK